MKTAFLRIRDRLLQTTGISTIEMAVNPVDEISWDDVTGVENQGVLLLAEKGLILRTE